ncbi:double-stranded DNA-binding domain-containing protein [Whalleya microplaca]|nr:double-stranded DNA-binding domain-containing protein [Whalleya microplaca]
MTTSIAAASNSPPSSRNHLIPRHEYTRLTTNDKMEDAELEQIRKARLEQLKAQGGGGQGAGGGQGQGGQNQAEQQKQQEAEARQSILNQILHPEAADRLGRIRLVKEERATDIENRLIMLARTGQLRQKVTEDQLKELLNAVAETKEEEKIVVNRRKAWDDEDDDLLDL